MLISVYIVKKLTIVIVNVISGRKGGKNDQEMLDKLLI